MNELQGWVLIAGVLALVVFDVTLLVGLRRPAPKVDPDALEPGLSMGFVAGETMTFAPPAADGVLGITRGRLESALLFWEMDCREGRSRSHEETLALPAPHVAAESAAYLWDLLGRTSP